jgi:hypothetical protein
MPWNRVILLGEDRAHLDLLRGLSSALHWRIVAEHQSPSGHGAASKWVTDRLPQLLKTVRGMNSPSLGLLVAIDGDNYGCAGRLTAFDLACQTAGVAQPTPLDSLARLIPCWSIETWLLFFCRAQTLPETDKRAKDRAQGLFSSPRRGFSAPGVPLGGAPRAMRVKARDQLVAGILGALSHPDLPALDAARVELARGR